MLSMINNIKKLQKKLSDDTCGALIYSEHNRTYFTGIEAEDGILVISKENAVLLIDSRYIEVAKKEANFCEVVLLTDTDIQLPEVVKDLGIKTIGIEAFNLPVSDAFKFKKCLDGVNVDMSDSLSNAIGSIRMIKNEEEVENMKKAQKITDSAFEHILSFAKPGMTELEVKLETEYFMKKNGASAPSFDLITITGPNCSLPHGVPGERKLEEGGFLLMDIGAIYNGYCSDMTRTVAIGDISDELRRAYNTVLDAQLAAEKAIKAGVRCDVIDKIARDVIAKTEFPVFGHGLGHSVGIEIHEQPRFSPRCSTVLEPGMVMTVEPGIYVEGKFGIRIEDMVLVTVDGIKNFTESPKELITI